MIKPVRLQLSRKKGFNLQEHSKEINGLPAVNVARGKFGNPFKVGEEYVIADNETTTISVSSDEVEGIVHFYEIAIRDENIRKRYNLPSPEEIRAELAGKNLACWCPLDQPCHADVLLRIANEGDEK